MIKSIFVTIIIAILSFTQYAMAQERTAAKRENVSYIRVVLIKFKPGMVGAARAHIAKYFDPATLDAGNTLPITLKMQSGRWDNITFRAMENGMGDYEWAPSPRNIAFRNSMDKLHGEENVRKIFADFNAMVADRAREMGYRDLPPMEDD